MNSYAEKLLTEEHKTGSCKLRKVKSKLETSKEKWIRHYAIRMLKLWLQWQTELGISHDYLRMLRKDLAEFYEQPLKKMFIETTY
jgi:hypothetical protein